MEYYSRVNIIVRQITKGGNQLNEVYKCGICGKEYSTVEERMECEKKCIEAKEKQNEELSRINLKNRKQKVLDKIHQMEKERDEIVNVVNSKQQEIDEAYAKFYNEFGKEYIDPWEMFFQQLFSRR